MKTLLALALLLVCLPALAQSRFTRYVTNITDLININPNGNDRLYTLLCRDVIGDGGGGDIYWTPGSTASTNLGTVFASLYPGASGRFIRPQTALYEAAWFGAKADASTDCYPAITNALQIIVNANGGALRLPIGTNMVSKTITAPNSGNKVKIFGDRRDAVLLRITPSFSSNRVISCAVAGDVAGGYEFTGFTIDGTGNSNTNVLFGLVVTNLSSRELTLRDFKIHNLSSATGLFVDQTHTATFQDVLIDYCKQAADFGMDGNPGVHYFNYSTLLNFSAENCSSTNWVIRFRNALGVAQIGGTIEANEGPILVTDESDGYVLMATKHEDNGAGPYVVIDESKGAEIAGNEFINSSGNTNVICLRLGSNSYASQSGGFYVHGNVFKQFRGYTIELGGAPSGLGPRDPHIGPNFYWDCNQVGGGEPLLFTDLVEGQVLRTELSYTYIYNAVGVRLSNQSGPITGSFPAIADYSGATNYAILFPVTTTVNRPTVGNNRASYTFDKTINRMIITADGTNWNTVGYGDGSVSTISGSTGVLNSVTKWTGNGFQLSTNTIISENSNSVIIGTNALAPAPTATKLWVDAGGTNEIAGTSATMVVRNEGASSTANVLELISNGGGSFAQFRNDGSIRLTNLAPSKFVKTDASSVLTTGDAVTSVAFTAPSVFDVTGSPITGSGTIALTINGTSTTEFLRRDGTWASPSTTAGVTNVVLDATITDVLTVGTPTTQPTFSADDPGAHRVLMWDDTDGKWVYVIFSTGSSYDQPTHTWTFSGGGGSATNAIVSLNSRTNTSQFFSIGTAGTDFNIGSTNDTHTFNLPFASAANHGKLSSTNWTTFNNKLDSVAWLGTGQRISPGLSGTTIQLNSITNGSPLTSGIAVSSNANNLVVDMDILSLTEDATPDPFSDFLVTHDASAAVRKKVRPANILGGQGLRNSWRQKSLNINSPTSVMIFTPAGNLTVMGATMRGVVMCRTTGPEAIYMANFRIAYAGRRVDSLGGVSVSGDFLYEEQALFGIDAFGNGVDLNDNGGTYAGVTSATVTVATIASGIGTVQEIVIYFYVDQFANGTISFL